MADRFGVLPRAGGVMDQDPYELALLRIVTRVFDEKRKQDEDKKGH
jgi:hypothetical protein